MNHPASGRAIVPVQNPLVISGLSVPQPDVAFLRPRADYYARSHPTAADVLLVVEVADTTLRFDLRTKVPLYARRGIVEAWVVDVNERIVHVFREPRADGYEVSLSAAVGRGIACAALPETVIDVGELFPG